jgi:hypothetical protein
MRRCSGYIRWQVDTEPPVVNNVPDKYDLGCNPAELPTCNDLIRLFGIEAKDNCPHAGLSAAQLRGGRGSAGRLQVSAGVHLLGGGQVWQPLRQTIRWRSTGRLTREPPVVNNVPDKYDLGCNPAEIPDLRRPDSPLRNRGEGQLSARGLSAAQLRGGPRLSR